MGRDQHKELPIVLTAEVRDNNAVVGTISGDFSKLPETIALFKGEVRVESLSNAFKTLKGAPLVVFGSLKPGKYFLIGYRGSWKPVYSNLVEIVAISEPPQVKEVVKLEKEGEKSPFIWDSGLLGDVFLIRARGFVDERGILNLRDDRFEIKTLTETFEAFNASFVLPRNDQDYRVPKSTPDESTGVISVSGYRVSTHTWTVWNLKRTSADTGDYPSHMLFYMWILGGTENAVLRVPGFPVFIRTWEPIGDFKVFVVSLENGRNWTVRAVGE
jgi:hypothetical protein